MESCCCVDAFAAASDSSLPIVGCEDIEMKRRRGNNEGGMRTGKGKGERRAIFKGEIAQAPAKIFFV
jgi:hypothetical protein